MSKIGLSRLNQDAVTGALFCVIGVAFAAGATTYELGTARRMGPGYFPLILGLLLAVIGTALAVRGLIAVRSEDDPATGGLSWPVRPLLSILGANFAFGAGLVGLRSIGLPPLGLIPSVYIAVGIAAMAQGRYRPVEVLVTATVLAAGCYALFLRGLSLNLPAWPWFI